MEMNKCIETFYRAMINNERFLESAKNIQRITKFVENSINEAIEKGVYNIKFDFTGKEQLYVEQVMSRFEKEGFFIEHEVNYYHWNPIYIVSWDWTDKLTKSMSDVIYEKMLEVKF